MRKFLAVGLCMILAIWYWWSVHYPTIQEKYLLEDIYKKVDTLFLLHPEKAEQFHETLDAIHNRKELLDDKKQYFIEELHTYTANKLFETRYTYDDSIQKFVTREEGYRNSHFVPENLQLIVPSQSLALAFPDNQNSIRSDAYEPLISLSKAYYEKFQYPLIITSTRRSHETQAYLGTTTHCTNHPWRCAPAWHSEHQSWLAVDIHGLVGDRYERIKHNAHLYWFHQSYQHGIEIDHYHREDRHWRYVWVAFATHLYDTWQTFTQWYFNSNNNPAISS